MANFTAETFVKRALAKTKSERSLFSYFPVEDYVDFYKVPGRYYHNWQHILEVAQNVQAILNELKISFDDLTGEEVGALNMGIACHDIYLGKNAEVASATHVLHEETGLMHKIAAYIIIVGTKHFDDASVDGLFRAFGVKPPKSPNLGLLQAVLHDADLMILAAEPTKYEKYRRSIIAETMFAGYAPEEFLNGRKTALQLFLTMAKQGLLFRTQPPRKLLPTVIKNLQTELEFLRSAYTAPNGS